MITFPVTQEVFLSYQQQLAGRLLTDKEKELTIAWMNCFNAIYEDGQKHDHAALAETLAFLDKLLIKHEGKSNAHKFFKVCRAWALEAWKQGNETEKTT